MPMYQNYHFTAGASLEDVVKVADKIMGQMQWGIKHEFDKFDMSADYVRIRRRSLFGTVSEDSEEHLEMDVTLRYKEVGDKVHIFMLSEEPVGDAVAASTALQNPDKKRLLMDTRAALHDGLRAQNMLIG